MNMKYSRQLLELFENIDNNNKVFKDALYSGIEQCTDYKSFKRARSIESLKKSLIWQIWNNETKDMTTDEFFELNMSEWMESHEAVQLLLRA